MGLLKTDKLGIAGKCGFAAGIGCIMICIIAAVFFEDIGTFVRSILISLFGALFSISVGLSIIPEIIRLNSEQIGQKRARSANIELLNSLKGGHLNFIELEVKLGKLERWTTEWHAKNKETAESLFNFYGAIEREEINLSIHTKMTIGYMHPEIESRKEAYQYCLRKLMTITNSLALSKNKSEELAQFHEANAELFRIKFSLERYLEDAIDIDAAVMLNPNDASINTAKGFVLSDKGKFDEAIPWFEKAIRLDPGYTNAHAGMHAALKGFKQAAEANAANMACAKAKELV